MGVCLGTATLYYTFRNPPGATAEARKDSLLTAAVLGSLYWATAISAIVYPGSKGIDPEFGEGFPQFWPFLGLLAANWAGLWLERRRLVARSAKI
jgi:hypothetical protein